MFKQILIGLLYSAQVLSINLLLLKGTTEVLPENLKKYALYHGVPFAEFFSENYYIAGSEDVRSRIKYEIKNSQQLGSDVEQVKSNLTKYAEDLKSSESHTSRLLSKLYYRPVGGQFQRTEVDSNLGKHLEPEHIGNILRIIEKSSKKEEDLNTYLRDLKITKKSGSLLEGRYLNQFVKALIGSLHESDPSNPHALFAPGTTVGILLGYCLNKLHSKKDLEDYFKGLMGKTISLPDQQYSKEEVKQIIDQGVQVENIDKFADWLICATYEKKYKGSLPKIVSNQSVSFDKVSFPDCVETTVRNLCNIVTYDGSQLGVASKDIELSSSLAKFYQEGQASVPAEVGNNLVHQAWVNVIENMPGVSYYRIKLQGQIDSKIRPSGYAGFIPVDDSLISLEDLTKLPTEQIQMESKTITLYKKSVGDITYLLVPKNSGLLCYELLSTVSNIIVCLNNLLNLNLYETKSMIFTENFSKEYFKKMCVKLGWELKTEVVDNTKAINITICKDYEDFTIHLLHLGHGHVSKSESSSLSKISQNMLHTIPYKKYPEIIVGIMSLWDTVDIGKLFTQVDKNVPHFLQLLRNCDVINPDRRKYVIEHVLTLKFKNEYLDNYIADLIMGLPLYDGHYIENVIRFTTNRSISVTIRNSLKYFWYLLFLKEGISQATVQIFNDLPVSNVLSSERIVGFLEKGLEVGNFELKRSSIFNGIICGEDYEISNEQVAALLNKAMAIDDENIRRTVIRQLPSLGEKQVLDRDKIVKLSKEIMRSIYQDRFLKKDLMNVLQYLKNQKILTDKDIEEIKEVEKLEESKVKESLGVGTGLLKKSPILSMRHDPYALSDYMADWAGKQHAGYFEKLKQGYQSQTPGLDVKHLDLESEKQKLLEQQQMMQPTYEKLYETEHVGKPGNIQPIQNIMPFIAQQRQIGKIALPKVANIAKGVLITGVRR